MKEFSGYKSSGMSSWSSAGSSSDSEHTSADESEAFLPTITLSVYQLCKKLQLLNKNFTFDFINEEESNWENEEMAELLAENISPRKYQ